MRVKVKTTPLCLIVLIIVLITGCCNEQKRLSSNSGDINNGPLFKVDGHEYKKDDLPPVIKEALYKNAFEAYSRDLIVFQEFALRVHLAKKKNMLKDPNNPPELIKLLDFPDVSEKDAKALFDSSKDRLPPGTTFDQMKDQILNYLKSQKVGTVFQKEVLKMEKEGILNLLITAPVAPEITFDIDKYPTKGKKDAKVSVIEISDYLCGHCQQAHPIVMGLMKKYKDQISFTQINFSLGPQGLSGTYVKGGHCAYKQGNEKFWKYHDLTFEKASQPHEHTPDGKHVYHDAKAPESIQKVMDIAKDVGLDLKKFKECLGGKESEEALSKNGEEMSWKGINGTPVFIVNNKRIQDGIYGLEKAIEEQLKK
jgi:protein-disulfide isomerase